MKRFKRFSGIAVILMVLITACVEEESDERDVEGKYKGTLSGSQLKSTIDVDETKPASAEIVISARNEILVHCYSDNFDTIFLLNYYHHHDSVYVCLTGGDFERMYGHQLGRGHTGHMMDDKPNGVTEWMHHMKEEHKSGDKHFGGFNISNHHFSYTFTMNHGDPGDDIHFEGKK